MAAQSKHRAGDVSVQISVTSASRAANGCVPSHELHATSHGAARNQRLEPSAPAGRATHDAIDRQFLGTLIRSHEIESIVPMFIDSQLI